MESLGEIIKRTSILTNTSREGTDTSLGVSTPEATSGEQVSSVKCPLCGGAGFVYPRVPPEHRDFGKAVPCQCRLRELDEERLARLQHYSNLGPLSRLTFDNLISCGHSSEPTNQEMFRRAYEAAKAYAEKPEGWIIFSGVSGCGKTHLAAAIANFQIDKGYPVFFQVVPDLLDHLRSTFSPTSEVTYDELFEQVRNAPLLILDDLGTQSSTPWAEEKLYQIINHRFNTCLPTVITTDSLMDELDERLRTRLTDPSLSQVLVLEESQPSMFQQMGSLGLELLNRMNFDNFDSKALHLTAEERHSLQEAYRNARSFAANPEGWLVFLGTNGCGKTHLAAAIANFQLRQGKPVFFAVVPDLLDHLRLTFSPESKVTYDELFETIKRTPLLILDDFGTQAASPWAQEKLYQILNYRYNAQTPTVITSTYTLDEIESRFSSRMGDLRLSLVLRIKAPDYRVDRKPDESPRPMIRRGRRGH